MSRFNAILLVVFASLVWPAFSADPPGGTTTLPTPEEDIDPATGLARSSVVKPLRDAAPLPPTPAPIPAAPARTHIALVVPTAAPNLARLAEAVRSGFLAAMEAAGKEGLPVNVIAVDNEAAALVTACRTARAAGARVVVGGLTRDGAQALADSDCASGPLLALNELRGDPAATVRSVSLSLEHEARQVALLAVADGWRSAVVIGTNSTLSKRVQEAFEREWIRAAGEIRRITFSGIAEDAPAIRQQLQPSRADMVFIAVGPDEAVAVRPYISGMLPLYATSMSVNPRAETLVNVDLQGVRYVEMPWFVQPDHPAVMVYPAPRGTMSVEQERLYAFGIDAYRLALLMLRPDAPGTIDGVTGRISLEAGHVFARNLAPAEVDGGHVIPLRERR